MCGEWVCNDCETMIQAPVPAPVIEKGITTTLAQWVGTYGVQLQPWSIGRVCPQLFGDWKGKLVCND